MSGGTLNATHINNSGTINFSGGTLNSDLWNYATMAVYGDGTKIINGDVYNIGSIQVTNAKITSGSLFNSGQLTTDPAALVFKGDLFLLPYGIVNASAGDQYQFYQSLNIMYDSTFNNTLGVELKFRGGVSHDLSIPDGTEWRKLTLEKGNEVSLPAGITLSAAGFSGLNIEAGKVTNISGGSGTVLYYDPLLNPMLSGTYDLSGQGSLIPGEHSDFPIPMQAVWTGPTGGMWKTDANWDIGVPPSGNTALVYGNGIKDSVIVNYNSSPYPDYTNALGSLQVDYGAKIVHSGSDILTVGNTQIGIDGFGSYEQTDGLHAVVRNGIYDPEPSIGTGILALGVNPNGNGTYTLTGGAELTVDSVEYIGYSGTGTFNQSGGTNTIYGGYLIWQAPWNPNWQQYAGLVVGKELGSSGTYNLTSGSLNVTNATIVGGAGNGSFNLGDPYTMTGDGIHTTGDLYVGYNTGSDPAVKGVYNLYSGTLNVVGGNGLMGSTVIGGKDYNSGPGIGEFN
jgi:hypothetical protein